MENKNTLKKIRTMWWMQATVVAIVIALFETGFITQGLFAPTPATRYVINVAAIMLTMALIPLAIKGFSTMMRKAKKKKMPHFIDYYRTMSNARISILFTVVMINALLYYGMSNEGALYCGILGLAAAIYSYPTEEVLNIYMKETGEE